MINKANLKKRLMFVAVAVPISFVIVSSQFSLSAFALGLFGIDAGNVERLPHVYPGQVLSLIIVMLGAYEYTKMLSAVNKANAFWIGHLWLFFMSAAYLCNRHIPATLSNSVLLMIVAFEAFAFGREAPQGRWKRASLFFCGMIFLSTASTSMMSLYREPFGSLFDLSAIPAVIRRLDVVLVITSVFLCDSAAYFVGSAWGKRRLSQSISPNKTVEGSLAGLAASVIAMTLTWIFLRAPEQPVFIGVIMGFIIGVMAQVGDLLVSLMKRYFMVKDASHMIPGHGGVLDRFDSVFFTAPAIYLFVWMMWRFSG